MNYARAAYAVLTSGIYLSIYPFYKLAQCLSGRKTQVLSERLGTYGHTRLQTVDGSPRIWIHAVSVGEVRAAHAVISALSERVPGAAIVLSIATTHGYQVALNTTPPHVTCIYAPIDFIVSVRRALAAVQPDVLVCMETEIWPNWLAAAHQRQVPIAIVNGRLSSRSIRRYRKIRKLMAETLSCVSAFSMIHDVDANRIENLGAPRERIKVNGNAKFDLPVPPENDPVIEKFTKLLKVQAEHPVVVAGSIRGEEPDLLFEAYERIRSTFPKTLLIVAPRHMERVPDIMAMASANKISYQLYSDIQKGDNRFARVVILDTMGELSHIYSIATVVFCGGSLVPLGGQNILEAAVWGKPVVYGPYMDDFLDARRLLDKFHAGVEVKNKDELAEKIICLLSSPLDAARKGAAGKEAVLSCQGAAQKHADVICRLLEDKTSYSLKTLDQ